MLDTQARRNELNRSASSKVARFFDINDLQDHSEWTVILSLQSNPRGEYAAVKASIAWRSDGLLIEGENTVAKLLRTLPINCPPAQEKASE